MLDQKSLIEHGLTVSRQCGQESCFTYVCRKGSKLMFLKLAKDAAQVKRSLILELSLITNRLEAIPLLISQTIKGRKMEDDVVYRRNSIPTITPQTFFNAIKTGYLPLVEVLPGGFFVRIDSNELRKQREKLGISRSWLARIVGISKKALYKYENNEFPSCAIGVAIRIERVIGVPIVRHIEFMRGQVRQESIRTITGIFLRVMKKLNEFGMFSTVFRRAPFNLIANDDKGNKLLIKVARKDEVDLEEKMLVIKSVSRVAMVPWLIISERAECEDFLSLSELERIKNLQDLLNFARFSLS